MTNESKDPEKAESGPATAATEADAAGQGGEKRSGRVGYDARGNTVWEWQLQTGVYSRDINTQKLKKLDLGDLAIAESAIQKRPPGLGLDAPSAKSRAPGGGFNPYDNTTSTKYSGSNPYDSAKALGEKIRDTAPEHTVRRSTVAPAARKEPEPPRSVLSKLGDLFRSKKKSDDSEYE